MRRDGHNGNGHGHTTEIPDVTHIKNVDVTHETSDVSVSGLLKFVVALSVMTALVAVLMWGLFTFFDKREGRREEPAGPMALTEQERLPPEPRLQSAKGFGVKLEDGKWVSLERREPQAEYRVLREQWDRQLNCKPAEIHEPEHASPSDSNTRESDHGGATQMAAPAPCMPIEEAMKKLMEQQLPLRKQPAVEPVLPTAASSGRSQ